MNLTTFLNDFLEILSVEFRDRNNVVVITFKSGAQVTMDAGLTSVENAQRLIKGLEQIQ